MELLELGDSVENRLLDFLSHKKITSSDLSGAQSGERQISW